MCIERFFSLRAAVKLVKQLYKEQQAFTLTITYNAKESDRTPEEDENDPIHS